MFNFFTRIQIYCVGTVKEKFRKLLLIDIGTLMKSFANNFYQFLKKCLLPN